MNPEQKCDCLVAKEGLPCRCLAPQRKRKTGYSLGHHRLTGKKLHDTHEMLCALVCSLSNFYPKTSRTVRLALKASKDVISLRSELDNQVFRENPLIDSTEKCRIYYPGNNNKQS